MKATVFSIGSMNSEGMLSKNPKSGIHETEVARAVCASGSNPTGWQGGDLVVIKKSSDGGGKRCGEYLAGFQNTGRGWWNQREVAATVRAELDSGVGPNLVMFLKS